MVLLQGIKPRLMAHKNRQEYGLNYKNLFVSIAKIANVSIFLWLLLPRKDDQSDI